MSGNVVAPIKAKDMTFMYAKLSDRERMLLGLVHDIMVEVIKNPVILYSFSYNMRQLFVGLYEAEKEKAGGDWAANLQDDVERERIDRHYVSVYEFLRLAYRTGQGVAGKGTGRW